MGQQYAILQYPKYDARKTYFRLLVRKWCYLVSGIIVGVSQGYIELRWDVYTGQPFYNPIRRMLYTTLYAVHHAASGEGETHVMFNSFVWLNQSVNLWPFTIGADAQPIVTNGY